MTALYSTTEEEKARSDTVYRCVVVFGLSKSKSWQLFLGLAEHAVPETFAVLNVGIRSQPCLRLQPLAEECRLRRSSPLAIDRICDVVISLAINSERGVTADQKNDLCVVLQVFS